VTHASHTSNGRVPNDVGPVLDVIRRADETTVVLGGELDLHTVPAMRRVLNDECDRRPGRLILDLGGVEFIDSTAMQTFVATYRQLQAHGCAFVLESPSAPVQRVIEIIGLDALLTTG
jgi:anti-sigma B factor antagonist